MNKSKKKRWRSLYDLGEEFKSLNSYKNIVQLKKESGRKEPSLILSVKPLSGERSYFTIMGDSDGHEIGFFMYMGDQGLNVLLGYEEAMKTEKNMDYLLFETSRLNMVYSSPYDCIPEQEDLLLELGLYDEEEEECILFESCQPHFFPAPLNDDEMKQVAFYLPHFLDAVRTYLKTKKADPAFVIKKGYAYTSAEQEDGSWKCMIEELPFAEYHLTPYVYGNKDQRYFLKKQKHKGSIWEFDHFPDAMFISRDDFDRPFYEFHAIMIDHTAEQILAEETSDPDEKEEFINYFVANLIMEHGIPMKIRVANEYLKAALEDICSICGISLEVAPSDIMENLKEQFWDLQSSPASALTEELIEKTGLDPEVLAELEKKGEDEVLAYIDRTIKEAADSGKLSEEEFMDLVMRMADILAMNDDDWDEELDLDLWDDDDDDLPFGDEDWDDDDLPSGDEDWDDDDYLPFGGEDWDDDDLPFDDEDGDNDDLPFGGEDRDDDNLPFDDDDLPFS